MGIRGTTHMSMRNYVKYSIPTCTIKAEVDLVFFNQTCKQMMTLPAMPCGMSSQKEWCNRRIIFAVCKERLMEFWVVRHCRGTVSPFQLHILSLAPASCPSKDLPNVTWHVPKAICELVQRKGFPCAQHTVSA